MDAGLHSRDKEHATSVDVGVEGAPQKSFWTGIKTKGLAAQYRDLALRTVRLSRKLRARMTDLTVNERPVRFDLDPQTPLLWALRAPLT